MYSLDFPSKIYNFDFSIEYTKGFGVSFWEKIAIDFPKIL